MQSIQPNMPQNVLTIRVNQNVSSCNSCKIKRNSEFKLEK